MCQFRNLLENDANVQARATSIGKPCTRENAPAGFYSLRVSDRFCCRRMAAAAPRQDPYKRSARTFNERMHVLNVFKGKPDFEELALAVPSFKAACVA